MASNRSDGARTREALLCAAERLFAAQGVTAVSLRAINIAAGTRNVSAVHYHFGSKEAVVAAAVARRMELLAQERLAALEHVEAAAAGGAPALRAVVEAMVTPFLQMLVDQARGGDAVTFLARAAAEPGMSLERHAPPAFWDMIQRVAILLRRALPDLPERVVLLRVRFLIQQCFVLVTELQRLAGDVVRRPRPRELEIIGADFVDYLVGGLAAPSHAGTGARAVPASSRPPAARRRPGSPRKRTRGRVQTTT